MEHSSNAEVILCTNAPTDPNPCPLRRVIPLAVCTDLKLGVALEKEHIHYLQLTNIAVLLELLADLGADGGHGHVQRVHGLDLGGLYLDITYQLMPRF